ncbi:hypothetical protein [Acidithiobacillus sp.]|uniref:hypothetical protein n=1 Tax=Acidithiobacillus sp. TaxID=1872118 RepID=UPI0025BBC37D|nr:hypothetical protein [Acidithiobacillus sp.]
MSATGEIRAWAIGEYADADKRKDIERQRKLRQLMDHLQVSARLPDPAGLTVGSTERFLAERRIQKLTQEAAGLGYETPGQELRKEAGMHLAGQALGISL